MGTNGPRKWPGIGIGLARIGIGLARIGKYWHELVVIGIYVFWGEGIFTDGLVVDRHLI